MATIQTANYLLPGFVEEHGLWKGLWEAMRIGWLLTGPKVPPATQTTKQPQEEDL